MSTLDIIRGDLHKSPLPPGWRRVVLGEVCNRIDYGFTASADSALSSPRFLRITDIQNGKVDWERVPGCSISQAEMTAYTLADGDIVFARTGATTGKSYLIAAPPPAVFASYLIRVRPDDKFVDPTFLYWYFQSDEYWWRISQGARGGAQDGFNATMLAALKIPLPPLPEQKRITSTLREQMAAVERSRAAAKMRLEVAKALPAAFMRKYLEGTHCRRWPSVSLGNVCSIDARQVDPKLPAYRDLPHVNGENIEAGTGKLYGVKSAAQDRMTSGKYLFEPGVVLYSKLRPYLRKVALADFRGLCSADMYPLSFDTSRVDPRFALWVLLGQPFTDYAIGESQRARMPKLNRDQLFAWPFPLPPMDQQRHVADILERSINGVQALTTSLLSELAAINDLGIAILRDAFRTGIRESD
ncbi:MAG: restriction endonuclease subunit S [Pirellulales bacterium]